MVAVNGFYWPDHSPTAKLLTGLAEHLAQHHTPVTIITSRLSYDDLAASLPAHESRNGVAIRRVWTTRFGRAGLWGRALDFASFYFSATIALLIEVRRGDIILAKTDPPLISVVAAIVASYKGAHLVAARQTG